MADDKDLAELERDVELARARLAADIARLRAPETFESARQSVMDSISGYRDDAMGAAQTRANSFLDAVKAKAAANPAAAAAIVAGIAWRLYRHPPIASLLVGAGAVALARTDPHDDSLTPRRLAQRAAHRAQELKDRAAAQISQMTEDAVGGAQQVQGKLQEKLQGRLHEWSSAAERALESVAQRRRRTARQSSSFLEDPYQDSPEVYAPERSPQEERESRQRRDAYLLGFAALALGAAIGVARRRKAPGERMEARARGAHSERLRSQAQHSQGLGFQNPGSQEQRSRNLHSEDLV